MNFIKNIHDFELFVKRYPQSFDSFLNNKADQSDKWFDKYKELEVFGKMINLQIISKCNLGCYFCRGAINNIEELSKSNTMTQENFEYIVNKCTDYGIEFFEITPAIGEPMMDKDILKKMEYLESNELVKSYLLTTNLTMWKDEHFEFLKKSKKMMLTVSIYGYDAESFTKTTGKNQFELFEKNISKLKLTYRENQVVSDLELNIRCDLLYNNEFKMGRLMFDIFDLLRFDNCRLNNEDAYHTNRGGNLNNSDNTLRPRSGVCIYGPGIGGGILSNGDLLFCPFNDINKTGVIGNVFKNTLEEIYGSDSWKKIVSEQEKNIYMGICTNCTETW